MAVLPPVSVDTLLADRAPALPAVLQLPSGDVVLRSLLRFMPGRRAIFSGERADGTAVIIKVFSDATRSRQEFDAEKKRLAILQARKVAATRVIAEASFPGGAVLLLSHLGEQSAKDCLSQGKEKNVGIALQLVALTAEMHDRGLIQKDIHLNNFMRYRDDWHVIDAGAIECQESSITGSKALENLSLLLAQFPPLSLPVASDVAKAYGDRFSSREISQNLARVRRKRLRSLVKKSLRDCTEFQRVERGVLAGMCRREDLTAVEALLAEGVDASLLQGECLKDGNSATVWRAAPGAETVVIKRYNLKSLTKRLARQFRSRARNSWMNAAFLNLVHVSTPRALCWLSEKQGPFVGREYLVCANVNGKMLPELCEQGGVEREQALKQMADFFATMLLMRFSHGDSKYTNFLFVEGELQVIDLDGMVRFAGQNLEKDLASQRRRLFESWRPRESLAPAAMKEFDDFYQARLKTIESWL